MDFLGIGPLELLFIMVIALIVLGPRDIVQLARRAGRLLNRLYRSEVWGTINQASREFRDLPSRLAREAALEDLDESTRRAADSEGPAASRNEALDAWTPSPKSGAPPPPEPDDEEPADSPDPGEKTS